MVALAVIVELAALEGRAVLDATTPLHALLTV